MTEYAKDPEAIFLAALDRATPDERAIYVEMACAGDAELLRRVRELLACHDASRGPLDAAPPGLGGTVDVAPLTERPGVVIGPYKLLQQIGEGGMGTVFMAEQTQPVQRKVALKVIKPGMDSRQVIARFEAERQALAMMDHVNIARVFDAGATEAGRPYFVMELVHGVPITKYCDDNHLTPRERLELFVPVCQAIQHAHQKGIIHRDIKPSNVMVTLYDGKPVPKVIDFGVAKATEQKLTERTLFTQYGTMVGTLEYMSPEQAEMSALGVDTRSDIYSLGVLLYELLTGSTPLTHKRMKEAAYAEILRMIKEEEPPRPSTRLSDSGEALASISANRHTEPAKLTKLVRGELDWIVMKTLEKDRNRRYETANGFAMDVQRYLNDETVQACPPSVGYRFRKFVRRNKAAIGVAGLVLFFLVLLGGGAGWAVRDRGAREEEAARDRAVRRARVEAVAGEALAEMDRLQRDRRWAEAAAAARRAAGLFTEQDGPDELRDRVAARRSDLEMVERLEDIRLQTTAAPGGGFDIAGADAPYARVFRDFGIDVESLPVEEAAARVRARSVPRELAAALDQWAAASRVARGPAAAAWLHFLAVARAADPHPARDRMRDAMGRSDRVRLAQLAAAAAGPDWSPADIELLGLQLRMFGAVPEAVELLRPAQRRHPGDFYINHELATALMELDPPRVDEALRFYSAALAVRPRSPAAHLNLGQAHIKRGAPAEAEAAFRAAIALEPDFAVAHANLGTMLKKSGRLDEAIVALRTAIRLDPTDGNVHHNLGNALEQKGDPDGAIGALRTAARLGTMDPAITRYSLGVALGRKGRKDEAIAEYRAAIRLSPQFPEAHWNLGDILAKQGKFAEALPLLRRGHELGSKLPRWRIQSAEGIRKCEHSVGLDTRLSAVAAGRESAVGLEALELAEFALQTGRSSVVAVRLYELGFTDRPDMAEKHGRYNGACAAARAGTEPGGDAGRLAEPERARWRKQAVNWLRSDLAQSAKRLETGKAEDRAEIQKQLLHWQSDPDLHGLRDPALLMKLPEAEQEQCRRLWAEVARLLVKAARAGRAGTGLKKPNE